MTFNGILDPLSADAVVASTGNKDKLWDGKHWHSENIGLAPEQLDQTISTLPEAKNVVYGTASIPLTGIRVRPSDAARTFVVTAVWNTPELVNDTDTSYWTVQHPDLLVLATRRELEVSKRNSQGVNDFDLAIIEQVRAIRQDIIREEMAGSPSRWVING
jgi:hypothetical protein